jgi:hypothetical protein
MSERRSIPPMQYASTEDGHVNHSAAAVKEALTIPAGASRPFSSKKPKLVQRAIENIAPSAKGS